MNCPTPTGNEKHSSNDKIIYYDLQIKNANVTNL